MAPPQTVADVQLVLQRVFQATAAESAARSRFRGEERRSRLLKSSVGDRVCDFPCC